MKIMGFDTMIHFIIIGGLIGLFYIILIELRIRREQHQKKIKHWHKNYGDTL